MTIVPSTFTGYPHSGFWPSRLMRMAELLRKQIGSSVRNLFRPDLRSTDVLHLEPAANDRSCEVAGRPTSPILPCTSALINRSRLCSSTVVPALLIRSRPVDALTLSFECIASCCQAHNKNPSAWPGSWVLRNFRSMPALEFPDRSPGRRSRGGSFAQ